MPTGLSTGAPAPAAALPLAYPAMRLRWCGLALRLFLQRWAVYFVVGATVAGAGAVGFVQIIAAVAGWCVLPLFYASSHGAWLLAALPLQGLAGAGCVFGLRSLLWPAHWGESERALPIPPGLTLRSDAQVVLVALAPLLLVYGVGAAAVLGHDPAWLRPTRGRALAALGLASGLSLILGVALLQALRRPAGTWRMRAAARHAAAPAPSLHGTPAGRTLPPAAVLRWPCALLWLPLWRGPARRTGRLLALGTLALTGPAAALALVPRAAPWWLAAFALLALVVASRADRLARDELTDLLHACGPLPLAPAPLQHARAALALLPVLPGLALLCALLLAGPVAGLRPGVLAFYVVALLGSCAADVLAAPAADSTRSGRWLFALVLCVCLASEVLA